MRLTLRTLLAYLDDILEPAHAKEIGQKIDESSYATELTKRIREVMRRRRLSAPEISGPERGIDPNLVAEYLDNTLPPESVTDVERICLEADMHLAEVAACHQILTLVLGEPVDVPEKTRGRLYGLGPGARELTPGTRSPSPRSSTSQESNASQSRPASTVRSPDSGSSFHSTVPDYLKRQPLWRRALPFLLVTTVLTVWAALLLSDSTIFNGLLGSGSDQQQSESDEPSLTDNQATDGPGPAVPPLADPNATAPGNPAGSVLSTDVASAASGGVAAVGNIDPLPPMEEPGTGLGGTGTVEPALPPAAVAGTNGQVTLPSVTTSESGLPPVTPPAANPTTTVIEPPPSVPEVIETPIRYASVDGIVLKLNVETQQWLVLERDGKLFPGELIAVPAPFQARFELPDLPVDLQFEPGTLLRYLGPTNAAPISFEVFEGRLRAHGQAAPIDAANPLALGIAAPDSLWRIELLTGDTDVALEIGRRQPRAVGEVFGADGYTGTLYVMNGAARFADGQTVTAVNARQSWSVSPENRKQRSESDPADESTAPQPLRVFPEWLDPVAADPSVIERRYQTLFENEFMLDAPLSESLPPLIRSPDTRIAELAVECLALVQDIPSLVLALQLDDPAADTMRHAAIEGLRNWLPMRAENDEILKTELGKRFPSDDATVVYRLLWGFSEQDARNRFTAEQLIDWMEHDHIAVRELAIYQIEAITGRRHDFRPNANIRQRAAYVKRLRTQLERDGGLLPSLP